MSDKDKIKIKKRFGEHLMAFRKAKGLSPTQFGNLCDINSANVAKIERGEANLTLYTLIKIANALDISLIEL